MTRRGTERVLLALVVVMVLSAFGCSSGGDGDAETAVEATPAAEDVADLCALGAEAIVDRLTDFAAGLGPITPQEFLGNADIEGLEAFQNDVASLITDTTNQNSTLCDLNGLQRFVDAELASVEEPDLITAYLISAIRFGGEVERADVTVEPDDDLDAILPLLADGSTITLVEGTYRFEAPLLIGRDITVVGQGRAETVIESSAADAAIAVFGDGKLNLRDLSVDHVGDTPASVVLAFGAPVDIENVTVAGAVGNPEQGGSGNGILLSSGLVPGPDGETIVPGRDEVAESTLVDVRVERNEVAGIAVNDNLAPAIVDSEIADNALCGICFLGGSGGTLERSVVEGNQFGVQAGDRSAPIVRNNEIRDNQVVGIVLVGEAAPRIESNTLEGNVEAAIAVQEAAAPQLVANTIGAHPFGVTIVGTSAAQVADNTISGAEVGFQIAEEAAPTLVGNRVESSVVAAIVNRDRSAARIENTTVTGDQSVAMLVEGSSAPAVVDLSVTGGDVGVSFREQAVGTLEAGSFEGQVIGVQVEDDAAPIIRANSFADSAEAAVVVRSSGATEVIENEVTNPVSLGIGAAAASPVMITGNRVEGGETALSVIEQSAAEVTDNDFVDQLVAVQVANEATPMIVGNRLTTPVGVGVVYRDDSGGSFTSNTIVDPGSIGLQLIDAASPTIEDNTIVLGVVDTPEEPSPPVDDAEPADAEPADAEPADEADASTGDEADGAEVSVGILLSGDSDALVVSNRILGFVVGVQVEVSATPIIDDNDVDGGEIRGVGLLYRDDAAGSATQNRTRLHTIGIQVDDKAKPELTDNEIEWVAEVAILIQGDAAPIVDGTTCPVGVAGIGVRAPATPELGANDCELVTADN